MFQSYPFRINLKIILRSIFHVLLCSIIKADEHEYLRSKRAIGGESLDTSNFVLYIDPNGSRFIEVPREYMSNWLDDQKMWQHVRINLYYNHFFFLYLVVNYISYSMLYFLCYSTCFSYPWILYFYRSIC